MATHFSPSLVCAQLTLTPWLLRLQEDGEAEMLFMPYSSFWVESVPDFSKKPPNGNTFYTIVIHAYHENHERLGGPPTDVPVINFH